MGMYTDLAKVFVSLGSTGKFAASGDWNATGISAGGAAFSAGQVALKNTSALGARSQKAFKEGAPIIEATIVAIQILELMLGLGAVNKGDKFTVASLRFGNIEEDLGAASPNSTWTGAAAEAYAAQAAVLQSCAALMAEADKLIAGALAAEADQITETRRQVLMVRSGLAACIPVAVALSFVNPVLSQIFQVTVSLSAMGRTVQQLGDRALDSVSNGNTVHEANGKYLTVVDDCQSS